MLCLLILNEVQNHSLLTGTNFGFCTVVLMGERDYNQPRISGNDKFLTDI